MISRSNYEIVFIDYFDGKLDKAGQERLFAFLRANPDLEVEFNRYAGIHAEPDYNVSFVGQKMTPLKTLSSKTIIFQPSNIRLNSLPTKTPTRLPTAF